MLCLDFHVYDVSSGSSGNRNNKTRVVFGCQTPRMADLILDNEDQSNTFGRENKADGCLTWSAVAWAFRVVETSLLVAWNQLIPHKIWRTMRFETPWRKSVSLFSLIDWKSNRFLFVCMWCHTRQFPIATKSKQQMEDRSNDFGLLVHRVHDGDRSGWSRFDFKINRNAGQSITVDLRHFLRSEKPILSTLLFSHRRLSMGT